MKWSTLGVSHIKTSLTVYSPYIGVHPHRFGAALVPQRGQSRSRGGASSGHPKHACGWHEAHPQAWQSKCTWQQARDLIVDCGTHPYKDLVHHLVDVRVSHIQMTSSVRLLPECLCVVRTEEYKQREKCAL